MKLSILLFSLFLATSCTSDQRDDNDTSRSTDSVNVSTDAPDGSVAIGTEELDWVQIAPGIYDMGSNDGEDDESPVHSVRVLTFDITKTEITVMQYAKCVDESVCTEPIDIDEVYGNWGDDEYESHPVNGVSKEQATTFCTWAEGRLPTEAEWEYAAILSGGSKYPWGDDKATCEYAVMAGSGDGVGFGCGTGRTMPVCSKPEGNAKQDLCDMAGNVQEWCEDKYHTGYIGSPVDGSAWLDPEGDHGDLLRGGSFTHSANDLTTTAREEATAVSALETIGIRCVKDLDL